MDTSPPVSPRALNYIDSSPAAQTPQNTRAEYERLLADFPECLLAALRAAAPTVLQLRQFRQDLAASGRSPADENGVRSQLRIAMRMCQDQDVRSRIYSILYPFPDEPDACGATPLHAAIFESDEHLVRYLLEAGASPVQQSGIKQIAHESRRTLDLWKSGALRRAHLQIELELMDQRLLDLAGAGEQAGSSTGFANPCRHVNALFVDIAFNASDRSDTFGLEMAAYAGANALGFAIACGAPIAMVKILVEHGRLQCSALLAQADGKGDVPLVLAAACGRDDVVRLLLQSENGIDVNQQDQRGHSALMAAARNGDIVLIGHLLKQCGARCDLTNNHGRDARELAILHGYGTAFTTLHDWEAVHGTAQDRTRLNVQVVDAFRMAASHRDKQLMESLYDKHKVQIGAHGVQQSMFDALSVPGNVKVLRWLVDHAGADLSQGDSTGRRAEAIAGDLEAFEIVLGATYPSDASQWPLPSTEILWLAARHGSATYVQQALDAGADIDAVDEASGSTALVQALRRGDCRVVELLAKAGADSRGTPGPFGTDALACIGQLRPIDRARELAWVLVNHHSKLYKEACPAEMLLQLALSLNMADLVKKLAQDRQLDPEFSDSHSSLLEIVVNRHLYDVLDALLTPPAPVFTILNDTKGNARRVLRNCLDVEQFPYFQRIFQACNSQGMDVGKYVDGPDISLFELALKSQNRAACELLLASSDKLPVPAELLTEMLRMAITFGSTAVFDAVLLRLEKVTGKAVPYSVYERRDMFDHHGYFAPFADGNPECLASGVKMAIDMGSAKACYRFAPLLAELDPSVRKELFRQALLSALPVAAVARLLGDPSYAISPSAAISADDEARFIGLLVSTLIEANATPEQKAWWVGAFLVHDAFGHGTTGWVIPECFIGSWGSLISSLPQETGIADHVLGLALKAMQESGIAMRMTAAQFNEMTDTTRRALAGRM